MSVSDASILGEGLGLGGGETRQVDMFVNENHGHTLSSHLGCRDAKRRNLVPCHYADVWVASREPLSTLSSLYLYSRFLFHHSQSSQSISIYDREIGAKISVSISISRFLRLENLLYLNKTFLIPSPYIRAPTYQTLRKLSGVQSGTEAPRPGGPRAGCGGPIFWAVCAPPRGGRAATVVDIPLRVYM